MKILYITQYFYPEIGATSNRAYANAKYLSEKGHRVVILTEMPNHPKGVIFDAYRKKIFCHEKMDGFEVLRVWVYATPNKNFMTRIIFYLSFALFGTIAAIINWKRWDIVYVTSPPLFVGLIGIILKGTFPKIKFIFEVRDLWPESAVELGELRNTLLIRLAEKLENLCYKGSDNIISVTKGIHTTILQKFPNKSQLIPNGVDTEIFKKRFSREESKFLAIYAGTHGLIHSLETIVKAAGILRDEEIYFQFIGNGAAKLEIIELARSLMLTKVEFLNSVDGIWLSNYLSKASVGISTTKKFNLCKGTIPVKIFSYMACELPVILSGFGESVEIIRKAKCGIYVDPEDPQALSSAILWLKNHPNIRTQMGKNGRRFVEKFYDRRRLAEKVEKIMLEL